MDYNYIPKYVDENINYQAGEKVNHSDYNRNLNLLNVAVANNTDALKRILNNGGAPVLNALALNGAQLKRHRDVILQDSEDQVPSSKAVYEHVKLLSDSADARFNNVGNILDNQDTEMFKINKRIQVVNSLIEQQGGRFDEIEEDYAHITDTMRGGATGQVLAKQSSNPLDYTWTNLLPGPKGDPGNDGYTPIKGVDYIDGEDGYTPVKGVDYFDGEDGYTPIKGVDYFDGVDGTDGAQGPQGIPGPQGNPGTNGTNGTDGVDGAQGPQGIPGPQGPPGANGTNGTNGTNGVDGQDGYTPIKGVDYFDGQDGTDGADGSPGPGIAAGGSTNNLLVKNSAVDYDTAWMTLQTLFSLIYPVGAIYMSVVSTNPSTLFGGTWELLEEIILDTGWQDYSWANSTYIGTSQGSYTRNQWRVKNGILYVQCGAGATSTINTITEIEIARIPIKSGFNSGTYGRIWCGAVGGGGSYGGFYLVQNDDYISLHIKPHTTTNGQTSTWFSSYFSVPLDNSCIITGTYEKEYKWKRTA